LIHNLSAARSHPSAAVNGAGATLVSMTNEGRRLTLEDVERRFRRSAAVFGNY